MCDKTKNTTQFHYKSLWRQPDWAAKNVGSKIDHVTCLLRCENEALIEVLLNLGFYTFLFGLEVCKHT